MKALLSALALLFFPQRTQEDTVSLRFGWPETGKCEVFEEVAKKGMEATMRYDLYWAPLTGDEEGLLLEYRDFRFIEFNGMDATTPQARRALAQATAMGSAIPRMKIGPDGALFGFEDYDKMVRELMEHFETRGDAKEEIEALGQLLGQPQLQQVMKTKSAEIWNHWVSSWVGDVVRGTGEVWELDMEATGGVLPELHIQYGKLEEYRGVECIEVSLTGQADEEVFRRKLLQMLGLMSPDAEELPEDAPISRATKTLTVEGILAVEGLRPLEIQTSDVTKIWDAESGRVQPQEEEHTYYFDWPGIEPHGQN